MPQERQEPVFVLVRPQMGENVGAAARAMANFGLSRMRVVGPRDGWPNPKAVAMASGAGGLLDEAILADDVPDAIADCQLVLATTARPRDLVKDVHSPEAAMALARERIAAGERVAVLFGPERAGLENEDIAVANAIVSVPVDPAFPSLNLAQCVLLMAYEWRRAGLDAPPTAPRDGATAAEIAALARHWEGQLDEAGFFFPPEKAAHMKLNLRNLWSRLALTHADVQILHGALRQLVRRRQG
jgi:tRNA/rRNA methyltransferase